MSTVELIEVKLEEFGLDNINEGTIVFVDTRDGVRVDVEDSEFEAFNNVHSVGANTLLNFDDDVPTIDHSQVSDFVTSVVEAY